MAGLSDDVLEAALSEAMAVSIVEERSSAGAVVTYRFTHAFFRQTLYEETIAPRRIRLHQQVARALEAVYGRRLEEHAAELAEHYAYSSDQADLAKAVEYGELAAQRAMAVYAHGEAVRHLEQALAVQEVLDPDDKPKRCDLLLALGDAQMPLGEPRKVADTIAPEAFALAETLGDVSAASRTCRMALEALHRADVANVARDAFRVWADRADRAAAAGTRDRAYADIAMGRDLIASGQRAEGVGLLQGALKLARTLDDPELLFSAAWQNMRNLSTVENWKKAEALAAEFIALPRHGVSARTVGQILEFCGSNLLSQGDRDRAEAAWRDLRQLAERSRDAFVHINALTFDSVLAVLDGRLDDAAAVGTRAFDDSLTLGGGPGILRRGTLRALFLRGLIDQAPDIPADAFLSALRLAYSGHHEQAQHSLTEELTRLQINPGQIDPHSYLMQLSGLLEAAILLKNRDALQCITPILAPAAAHVDAQGPYALSRHLGDASALLGDRAAARKYYEQALEVAGRVRFRPEIALTHLGIAELLLDAGAMNRAPTDDSDSVGARHASPLTTGAAHRAEALGHLDFAIAEFRDMKMQPSLERALRHKEVLKA